jgi:hypothetical protein
MNPVFFEQVAQALATERLDAYRQDGAAPAVALARYVWNMALCEALYSPLQLAEVALRNAQHRALTTRFGADGLAPWIARIRHHWPEPAGTPSSAPANATLAIIPDAFDASSGAETPFGHRWGGDVFRLASEHLAALQAGQTLALDVQSEYIAFLKAAESAKRVHLSAEALAKVEAIKANLKGLGYGG